MLTKLNARSRSQGLAEAGPASDVSAATGGGVRRRPLRRWPSAVVCAFGVLLILVAVDTGHELFGLAGWGYSNPIDNYSYDIVAFGAAILMITRSLFFRGDRAWLVLGIGTLAWVAGDILRDIVYGDATDPIVSASEPLWLLWYPATIAGMVMLVRSRLTGFDLARWIDGIALALVIATPGVALAVQPTLDASHLSLASNVTIIAYPILDILLLGAAVGVIALAGWRPGAAWYLVVAGLAMWLIADAIYAVQRAAGPNTGWRYDFLWPAGIFIVACAAWQPRVVHKAGEVCGWRAVALPIICQLVAFGTQIWGLIAPIGESERIMTMAVLVVVVVQLFVSRPRGKARMNALLARPASQVDSLQLPG